MDLVDNLFFPYPHPGFFFDVKIIDTSLSKPTDAMSALKAVASVAGSMIEAGFQEVSGLETSLETEEVIEGGENRYVHQLPKKSKSSNLILKRGTVVNPSALNQWCEEVIFEMKMPIKTKMVIITLLNEKKIPVMVWKVNKAYPVKYEVSGFNAQDNQILIESFELAYTKFERVAAAATAALSTLSGI